MNPRHLILGVATAAVALFPLVGQTIKPCPPPQSGATGGSTVTTACGGGSYSTSFPLTESPISEGGNWVNNATSTFTHPVITTGGHAVGPNSSGDNDAVAQLVGTYGRDQVITAHAYHSGASGPAEIELHLRMLTIAPDQIYTYEVDIIPSLSEINLMKWSGNQGSVVQLTSVPISGVNDGDTFVASAVGPANATVFTVKLNGTTILTYTDTSAFVTGNPGIGFDAGNPSDGDNFGWVDYSVTTS